MNRKYSTAVILIIITLLIFQGVVQALPVIKEKLSEGEKRILKNDTTEIGAYIRLASDLLHKQHGNSSQDPAFYLDKAYNIAITSENEHYYLELIEKEGVKLRDIGDYKNALYFHFHAYNKLTLSHDPGMLMRCSNNIGVVYRRIDDYQRALEYHLKALRIADSLQDFHSKAISTNSIGNINFLLGDYQRAIDFFEQSLALESEVKSNRGIAINLNNLGNVYLALNDHIKAKKYYQESFEVNRNGNNLKGMAICYNDLGRVCQAEKDYVKALEYFGKALELFMKTSDLRYVVDSRISIAKAYMQTGNLLKAEQNLKPALKQAEKLGVLSQLAEINQMLSTINEKKYDQGKALQFFKKSILFKDSLLNETNRRNIAAIQTRFETEKKAKEIEILKHENLLRDQNLNRQKTTSGIIIGILLISAIGIFLAYKNKKNAGKKLQQKTNIIEKAQQELKRYSQELELAITKAENLAEAKSQFLANMSHEIRTPLNSILGFTDLLARDPSAPMISKYINSIRQSGRGLLAIINDILDLAYIESGKAHLSPTKVNLAEFLNEILAAFSLTAEEKNLKLSIEYLTNVPVWLIIDVQRLRQILFNLIGNALKFTDRGKITIFVSVSNECTVPNNQADLSITVSDTGKGIASEHLQLIFDSFSQIKPSNAEELRGNGLGLAISQRLSHLMGGQLSVESKLNIGSSFTLKLPDVLIGSDIIPLSLDSSSIEARFSNSKVLVVDDIADNRLLLKEFINFEGISVLEACDGESALNYAKNQHPDLILLDIRMPGIDGFEVNRRLKEYPQTAKIPTIAVSASVYNTDREQFVKAGFHDFLSKPLQFNELLTILHKYLGENFPS